MSSLRETYGKNCSFHLCLFPRAVLIAAYKINSVWFLFLWAINNFLCNKGNMSPRYGYGNVFVTNKDVSILTSSKIEVSVPRKAKILGSLFRFAYTDLKKNRIYKYQLFRRPDKPVLLLFLG